MAFMNPGAAFSSGIEQFMLQKAAAERQARQDAIAAQAAADRHAEAEAALARDKMESALKVEDKARAKVERTVSGMVPGDIADSGTVAQARVLGVPLRVATDSSKDQVKVEQPSQVVQTMGGETPAPPAPEPLPLRFAGNPAQAKELEAQRKQVELGEKLKGVTDRKQAVEIAIGAGVPYAQVDDVVNAFMGKAEAAPKPVMRVNPRTGKMEQIGEAPANAHFVNEPAPPSANGPQPQIFYDANGKPHAIQFVGGQTREIPLPGGITGKTNPITAQVWSRVNAAKKVGSHIEDLKSEIEEADRRGLLGPLKGRTSDFMLGKIGSTGDPANDELLAGLRLDISAVKSGFGMVHSGSRSAIGLLQRWDDVLNGKQMSKDALIGSLNAMQGWLDSYASDPTKTEEELAAQKPEKNTTTPAKPKRKPEDYYHR